MLVQGKGLRALSCLLETTVGTILTRVRYVKSHLVRPRLEQRILLQNDKNKMQAHLLP
jgi:hypothetical protein